MCTQYRINEGKGSPASLRSYSPPLVIHPSRFGGGGGDLVAKSCLTLATPGAVAHQAPLSMGFPRQEYWNG